MNNVNWERERDLSDKLKVNKNSEMESSFSRETFSASSHIPIYIRKIHKQRMAAIEWIDVIIFKH